MLFLLKKNNDGPFAAIKHHRAALRRSIRAHVPLCAHPQWRRRRREAQIPMMHLASLFCRVGAARVFVWLPRPSRLVASEARSRSLRLPLLQTSLTAVSFLANSHRVPPFIFFTPPRLHS